ncbi:MAG: biotin-independent malonate decarboxylase subunit beta [Solidesulfovibrio sp. DCME]|uniref:biotin-independent malonate decarboxylase subunit beta n=1 Tax=Solidesulfovibrio sp. DCME TaxID=3447380 RepID=UPI003D1123F4
MFTPRKSWFEASARHRLDGLVDPGTFREFAGPGQRLQSPTLAAFDLPTAFDDGAVVGVARVAGHDVAVAAQEGKFMGGAFGEVHAAKVTGLLRRALTRRPKAVVLLLDSGGVRLQEANAGEIGATEIIRGVLDARAAGIPVYGLIGGSCGCFGGAGILAGCLDALVVSEQGRIGVSGPEVIETTMGVEAFDSRDRALVWRTTGGKNRYLCGMAETLVPDDLPAFRQALVDLLEGGFTRPLETAPTEQKALEARLAAYGQAGDAVDIWRAMGLPEPERIPEISVAALCGLAAKLPGGRR